MKWWLYNRFRYLDSKYVTGSSMENRITIRAHQKANVFLKAYANIVGHVYFNAAVAEHRMERNKEYEFEWPASGAEDPVIGINDADLMTSLGDLSPLMVELIDVSGAPHITDLKIGDAAEGYVNYSMNSITLGNNVLLRTLDLRNCVNLTQSVDASGCTNIEEVYFDGTSVTGVSLPNGGILKVLHLPETVTNLTVLNQKAITDFTMAGYSNVTTLRVENSPAIPALTILAGMPANSRVRIVGFDLEMTDSEFGAFITKLDTMRGLDENGNNTDLAQVSGRIYVAKIGAKNAAAAEKYVGLNLVYDEIVLNSTKLVERTLSGEYTNDRVTSIGPGAFYGCSALTGGNFPLAETIGEYAFPSVPFSEYLYLPKATSLPWQCFVNLKTEHLCFPAVTMTNNRAFYGSWNLKTLDFHSITSMAIWSWPTNVLETLIIRTNSVCKLTDKGIDKFTSLTHIYVPSALVDSYKAATNWSVYADRFRAIEDYPEQCTICGGEVNG